MGRHRTPKQSGSWEERRASVRTVERRPSEAVKGLEFPFGKRVKNCRQEIVLLAPDAYERLKYFDIIKMHNNTYRARDVRMKWVPPEEYGSFTVVTYVDHVATNELHRILS